jgi:penicillin-binding protein 2
MSLFGDFYENPIKFNRNKKELMVSQSEDWSAAILSGSSDLVSREGSVPRFIYFALGVLLIAASGMLVSRLFSLQIVQGKRNSLLANSNRVRTTIIPAPRGAIYDRSGVLLARNVAQYDLVATPSQLPKSDSELNNEAGVLASILSKPQDEVLNNLKNARKSEQTEVVIESNIDRNKSLDIDEKSRDLGGLSLDTNPQREYLDAGMLSPFLGYIGRISAEEWKQNPEYRQVDMIGKSGVEYSYESDLRGVPGKEQVEVDSTGKPVRFLARVEPVAGKNIYLTVDWGLQQQMYNALKTEVDKAGSKAGSAVALDPQTGEVLAAVSYPTYDGNLFAKGISQNDYNNLLNNDAKPLLNRVIAGNYPVGSIIKPLISVAALQENVINSSTTVVDKGKLEVPNVYNPSVVYTFKGWKPEGLGVVNVTRAIEKSSDIFYYQVGGGFQSFQGLGERRVLDWYSRFGLGNKTGLDVGGESSGYLPSPEKKKKATGEQWYVGDTYNISIGQGDLKATPLQMAVANASIANGGKILKPHLLGSVMENGSLVRKAPVDILKADFISADNLRLVQQGMQDVVASGTACCSIKNEVPVPVAGKTGTAETSSEGFDGKNPRTKPHAWFSAYAPANNPRIATVVMIENSGEGSTYAAPATKEILKWYFSNR